MHGGGQGLRVAVGIGHHQSDCAAWYCIGSTSDGRGVVVGVIRRIHTDGRRGHINTAIVGRGAGVAGRIGDAGRYLIAAFRQRGGDIHAVATTRLHYRGQGLLSAIGIGHHQGDCAARGCIGCTCDVWSGVSGVVRRIDRDGRCGHIHAAIVGCRSCIPSRICHCGGDGIRTLGQWGNHIHGEGACGCDNRSQGLLIAVGIGHHQGHRAANGSIRGSGQGRSGVIGVIWRNDGNGGRSQVKYFIFASSTQRWLTIGVVGGIEGSFGNGCGTGTVDGDKTAVATGSGYAPDTATTGGRCSACCRSFKGLGRVRATQNGLL